MSVVERFLSKIEISETGCWLWTGGITRGYGKFADRSSHYVSAHRFAYELFIGKIPEGLTLDHMCHDSNKCLGGETCLHRRCVNPSHLKPATLRRNVQRAKAKTHCKHGHEFTSENTYMDKAGKRQCRTCKKVRAANTVLTRSQKDRKNQLQNQRRKKSPKQQ